MHNIIVGKLWAEQSGQMTITNHSTGDTCNLVYHAYSYFSSVEVCCALITQHTKFTDVLLGAQC